AEVAGQAREDAGEEPPHGPARADRATGVLVDDPDAERPLAERLARPALELGVVHGGGDEREQRQDGEGRPRPARRHLAEGVVAVVAPDDVARLIDPAGLECRRAELQDAVRPEVYDSEYGGDHDLRRQ